MRQPMRCLGFASYKRAAQILDSGRPQRRCSLSGGVVAEVANRDFPAQRDVHQHGEASDALVRRDARKSFGLWRRQPDLTLALRKKKEWRPRVRTPQDCKNTSRTTACVETASQVCVEENQEFEVLKVCWKDYEMQTELGSTLQIPINSDQPAIMLDGPSR